MSRASVHAASVQFSFFVGFILLAATFYPSKAIMKRIEDDAFVEGLLKHRETIVKHYF